MLLDRIDKETTDISRVECDMTWWLDEGETVTTVVSQSIDLGTTGWSEAPYPPPGAPPPYDPTPLTFGSVAMDLTGTVLTLFVRYGTPGNVYTCQFVLQGSSTRRVTVEVGVQLTGVPPVQPLPVPVLPPPQGALALSITGGTLQGPLYLFEDPLYPTEAATKAYVDLFLPLIGGFLSGPLMLAADPTSNLQAATKQYVDAHSGTGGSGGAGFLPISGGQMTGPLTLATDPTVPLQAATKQYVDATITRSGGPFLPIGGGTLTGDLVVNSRNLILSSGASDAYLSLSRNAGYNGVILGETAGSGRWMIVLATSEPETGGNAGSNFAINRLSDAGAFIGTPFVINRATGNVAITQNLTVGNGLGVTGTVTASSTAQVNNGRVISRGTGNNPGFCAYDIGGSAAGGMFQQGTSLCFGQMDGNGNAVNVLALLAANGDFVCEHALVVSNVVDAGFNLSADGTYKYINFSTNGYQLRYGDATGQLGYYRGGDGAQLFQIDTGGNTYQAGQANCDSVQARSGVFQVAPNYYLQRSPADGAWRWVEGGTINLTLDTSGDLFARGNVVAGGTLQAGNNVVAGSGSFAANTTTFGFFPGGSGRVFQFSPSWYWDWNGSSGELSWTTGNGQLWKMAASNNTCWNNLGPVGGVGAYENFSDERGKTRITPAIIGLAEVIRLDPIDFVRVSRDRVETGFSAQQVQGVIPVAVHEMDFTLPKGSDPASPALAINIDPIVAALVNATKEINARLSALEASSLR